jgi:hypothetical protein
MRTTLAIVAILALAGCATSAATESRFSPYAGGQAELDLAKRAILASLKDPESAIFTTRRRREIPVHLRE